MTPSFLHIMSTGDIWYTNNYNDTPSGTIVATFRLADGAILTKIGTISGSGPYTCSGGNGKTGKDIGTH